MNFSISAKKKKPPEELYWAKKKKIRGIAFAMWLNKSSKWFHFYWPKKKWSRFCFYWILWSEYKYIDVKLVLPKDKEKNYRQEKELSLLCSSPLMYQQISSLFWIHIVNNWDKNNHATIVSMSQFVFILYVV